jgi:hypothetical protein
MSMTIVLLRMACFLLAGLCALAAWEIVALAGPRGPWRSPLMTVSLVGTVVGAVVSAAIGFAPLRVWMRFATIAEARLIALRQAPIQEAGWAGMAIVVLGIAAYVVLLTRFFLLQTSVDHDDQEAYLAVAQELHAAGGPLALPGQLFRGEFEEANRHPLYIGLLSVYPEFTAGKTLSAGIGLVTLLLLCGLVARRFGLAIAGVFCVLLATNFAFCFATTLVTCEGLVVLFSGLAWLVAVEISHDNGSIPRLLLYALLGAMLGLSYLAKGTALLLVGGTLVWIVLRHWRRAAPISRGSPAAIATKTALAFRAASLPLACTLLAFLVVASPLLVRNARRYGSPFFNLTSYFLFEDQFSDPLTLARQKTVSAAARDYLRTHTLREIAARQLHGMVWEAFVFGRTLGPVPLPDARIVPGLLLAFLSGLGMLAESRRGDWLLTLIWSLLIFLAFAWYVPICVGDRFVLPVIVPLLTYAASGTVRLVRHVCRPDDAGLFRPALLMLCFLWVIGWTAASLIVDL